MVISPHLYSMGRMVALLSHSRTMGLRGERCRLVVRAAEREVEER